MKFTQSWSNCLGVSDYTAGLASFCHHWFKPQFKPVYTILTETGFCESFFARTY